jgi:signal transduction histidine kinase
MAVSGMLASQGWHVTRFTDRFNADAPEMSAYAVMLMAERRASVVYLADPQHDHTMLPAIRERLDASTGLVLDAVRKCAATDPTVYSQLVADTTRSLAQLPAMRQRIDNQQASLIEVADYYSGAMDALVTSLNLVAKAETVSSAAVALVGTATLLRADSVYLQADELALAAAIGPGLSQAEYARYAQVLGGQRALLDQTRLALDQTGTARLDQLRSSPAWQRLDAAHHTILMRGPASPNPLPPTDAGEPGTTEEPFRGDEPAAGPQTPTPQSWNADTQVVLKGFVEIGESAVGRAFAVSREAGQSQLRRAALIGALLLLVGIVVLLLTTRASGRLIGRLRRLREETLRLSQERLPGVVGRLRAGERVDVAVEVAPLDLGDDEIGQVASAFNQAQETAIAAAVGEAQARAGLRTVFLNIAHRSQGIVHRQLNLLDQAERSQEDPDQLSLLFELDHLTTRARRNAENLVILGGGQAGRQWRQPVPLVQVVRGAISEARDYVRVSLGALPPVRISGGAVADVIHTLAELVDNATSFSPPMSRVEVRGNAVGRGIALEIEDQGLGIEPQQLEQLNAMLHQPPDFQVMALSDEPRLGIFVVAQLAARQGIRVTLTPSPAYGGTRVVVLIPSNLIDSGETRSPVKEGTPPQDPAPAIAGPPTAAPISPVPPIPALTAPAPTPLDPSTSPLPRRTPVASASAATPQGSPPGSAPGPWTGSVPVTTPPQLRRPAGDEDHPPLPRRHRQAHLAPQLRTSEAMQPVSEEQPPAEVDPELARQRLSAFQYGTRRAREGDPRSDR